MFTMGGKVLLFKSFLVYRGASHTDTHTQTLIQMHLNTGSRRYTVLFNQRLKLVQAHM